MDYPIWNPAPGGGLLMALVAIPHVIVAHFAIGGGLLVVFSEMLATRRGDDALLSLARRGSLMLVLVSTVFGAISGVGIWVVAGLISPGAISSLIHHYVWGWAIEWTFFIVEIVAALIYYATWEKISRRAHLAIGWIYFVAAYLSLVIINGIITFMLTPGRWLETRAFWDGFFNPTYWPSLLLRTGICVVMASVFLLLLVGGEPREARSRLVRYLATWLTAGSLVAYGGYRWWESALPGSVTELFRGDQAVLSTLASTRSLTLWALAIVLLLGGVLLVVAPRAGRLALLVLVALAAFTFFGGYERLREGVRKPFLIHGYLFSNGLAIDDVERVNEQGMAAWSGWVARRSTDGPAQHGREIFRAECASCHTLGGYQSIRALLPTVDDMLAVADDLPAGHGEIAFRTECASCHVDLTYEDARGMVPGADEIRDDPAFVRELDGMMIAATLEKMKETDGAYAYMPPFVGNDEDLEALSTYLAGLDGNDLPAETTNTGGGQ
jgi:mono/diheme cytochrome c family protein